MESRRFDCLVVYNSSRLFRNLLLQLEFIDEVLLPHNVDFFSATESFDFDTPQGRMGIQCVAMMNESYRTTCMARNRDAMATRVEQGYPLGPPPFGWRYEARDEHGGSRRRGFERDPAEEPHLMFMKDRYLAGMSCVKIAGEMNDRGIPSPGGVKWSALTVIKTLKNPVHAGMVVSKTKGLLEGAHLKNCYWDVETRERMVQLCEQRNERWKTNTSKSGSPHLVNGLVHCARCGIRLYPNSAQKYRSYRCCNGATKGRRTCSDVSVRAEVLEDAVVAELEKLAREPEMRQLLLEAAQGAAGKQEEEANRERDQLTSLLDDLAARRARLLEHLSRNTIDEEEFESANQELRDAKRDAQERLAKAEVSLTNKEQRQAWAPGAPWADPAGGLGLPFLLAARDLRRAPPPVVGPGRVAHGRSPGA